MRNINRIFFRKTLVYMSTLILAVAMLMSFSMNVISEETGEGTPEYIMLLEDWATCHNGTYFEISNSSYLNISLTSSENIHLYLYSHPKIVSYHVKSNCSSTSTFLTLAGFETNKTYHIYQNGILLNSFISDENGHYSYIQDITEHNHLVIQENISTIEIRSDGSIWPSTAPINKIGNTYYLTDNIANDRIYILCSNIIFDGQDHTIFHKGWKSAIYVSNVQNVVIRNFSRIQDEWGYGIWMGNSHHITVENCKLEWNTRSGICLEYSTYVTIDNVTILYSTQDAGIRNIKSRYTTIQNSSIINNYRGGIFNFESHDYHIYDSIIKNNDLANPTNHWGISNSRCWGYKHIVRSTISDHGLGGIYDYYGGWTTVTDNIIDNNGVGLFIEYQGSGSTSWIIVRNNISNNNIGLEQRNSENDIIYHNTFWQNNLQYKGGMRSYGLYTQSVNTWDNGAGEGNYWSDYFGTDDGSNGRTSGDGVGDTLIPHPYITDTSDPYYLWYELGNYYLIDNYPLMSPWTPNLPPIAQEDYETVLENSIDNSIFVLLNDVDPDEDDLSITDISQPLHGISTNCNTYVTYTPDPEYFGSDSFTYTISDGSTSDTSAVYLTIESVNDPPIADAGGPYQGNEGIEIFFDASESTDPNEDVLGYRWDFNLDGWDTEYSTDSTTSYTWYDDQTLSVLVEVTDGEFTDSATSTILILDLAPTADFTWTPDSQDEGSPIQFTDTSTSYPDVITGWSWDFAGLDTSAEQNPTFPFMDGGIYTVTLTVTDDDGSTDIISYNITVVNVAPIADAGDDKTGDEPSTFVFSGSHTDPGLLDTHTYEWDFSYDGVTFGIDATGNDVPNTWYDDFVGIVALRVTDDDGGWHIDTCTVPVYNIAPTIDTFIIPLEPIQIGIPVDLIATFTDPGILDTHTATIDWDDGNITTGTITGSGGTYTVTDSWTYGQPGVYTITLTIEDDDGGIDIASFQYAVIYDPSAGFVTGGGWIMSPEGAYTPDPTLTGKANFGFVAKYKKGQSTPDGNTEFNFKVANMNFHSKDYEWLVIQIAGAKAMYKGTGTINGEGNYGFKITAIDEDLTPSTDVDMFRIKIWDKDNNDEIIYDNQLGDEDDCDPSTPISRGNIKIHKG